MARRALVFGAAGAIGGAVSQALASNGHEVVGTTRSSPPADGLLTVDPFERENGLASLDGLAPFDAVAWAQGTNVNDSVVEFDLDTHVEVLMANCVFVSATLAALLQRDLIRDSARLCVVSSIWQNVVRPGKFSYTVSKAALSGLVHSAAADLAGRGMLVNAVLPGVVDTAMTRSVLRPEQIAGVAHATGFERLTTLDDVAATVAFLCSERNTGVTGQSVAVDLGFSAVRHV